MYFPLVQLVELLCISACCVSETHSFLHDTVLARAVSKTRTLVYMRTSAISSIIQPKLISLINFTYTQTALYGNSRVFLISHNPGLNLFNSIVQAHYRYRS